MPVQLKAANHHYVTIAVTHGLQRRTFVPVSVLPKHESNSFDYGQSFGTELG